MSLLNELFRKKKVSDAIATAEHESESGGLNKNLRVWDLTALGIAAIIGAGIFSTIGKASFEGGPGVVFLFVFTAVACGFAAFAYAEFASMLPVSGSAYTYSYVAFGELIAWIIGWALIMEYAVGNITVAVSWSGYFTSLCESIGWTVPAWAQVDYTSAHSGFSSASSLLQGGTQFAELTNAQKEAYLAWTEAPQLGGLRMILDIPAIVMSILITGLVYIGIKESKTAGNMMVVLKMAVVLLVIIVGVFFVKTENWHPFVPNGFGGVMAGVSAVFYAYIGFDALSTTAEECKNPQRDLPRAMVYSIIICTILYILIALVLTGMAHYSLLNVDDPLSEAFKLINMPWMSGIVAVSAVVAMAGVFLVFQLGQPRIWMTMSRDGLLPKRFSHIHPKYKTPDFSTIITAVMVIVPMLFIPSDTVVDLCSMGTLFAFVLVSAGVLKLQVTPDAPRGKFKTPYINGRFIFPALLIGVVIYLAVNFSEETRQWLRNDPVLRSAEAYLGRLDENQIDQAKLILAASDSTGFAAVKGDLAAYLGNAQPDLFEKLPGNFDDKYESGWALFQHKIPMWLFIVITLITAILAVRFRLSLIPLLGMTFCLYMMAQIKATSWLGFFIWLSLGLIIYFGYSRRNSKLKMS